MQNDAFLVSRAALLGDQKAFSKLIETYQSPIRRFLFNLTHGDDELSKDLAQDTFVKAWLNIGQFRAAAKFSTWLYRIAYNTFYDYTRTKKPTTNIDDVRTDVGVYCNTPLQDDFSMDFLQMIKTLKPDERTAMLLFYMEDQTIEKISTIMNCPKNTVKSHLHRGKNQIAKYFEK
jgi:RNA polymerase sigma-70 factor (ECF subfamily)